MKGKKKADKRGKPLAAIVLIILIAAAAIYISLRKPAETQEGQQQAQEGQGANEGDLVTIDFVLTLANGTVVDTNNETLARENGISTFVAGPFRFILGQSGKVKGFDDAVKGMKPGETAVKNILASEQVLEHTFNRTRRVIRNQPFPRFHTMSEAKFQETFGKKPVQNDIVTTSHYPWPFIVLNVTNGAVAIEPDIKEGKSYKLPGLEWESTLVVKTFNDLVFRHNPEDGQVIKTELGPAVVMTEPGVLNITYQAKPGEIMTYHSPMPGGISMPFQFRVTALSGEAFTLTRINYLPQENLVLTAKMTEWTPDVKKVKNAIVK